MSQSIPRFGTDRNISTTFGWIDMELCTCVDGAQRMNPKCWHLLWLQQVRVSIKMHYVSTATVRSARNWRMNASHFYGASDFLSSGSKLK